MIKVIYELIASRLHQSLRVCHPSTVAALVNERITLYTAASALLLPCLLHSTVTDGAAGPI